ncbi:VOC family protein [Ammoniphilus sp. YIM 78166]|uniref:VOC family protein n=1 Tax=Ammoniphilus sp. YIM 78166 TaxID=1644106 RepID=UPI0010702712|nr:VOC family protein [Ammoniphilus sp. YIM 78166]
MIKKVEHTALIVKDMDQSIEYYQRLFHFQLRIRGTTQARELAFLFHPNQPSFEIELIRDIESTNDYASKGIVNHLAFTVENIEECIDKLKQEGVTFLTETPNSSIDGGKTIFFYGPNEELLQLVQPVGR